MKIANKDCREFVVKQQPFTGSNLFGVFFCAVFAISAEGQHGYVVYSYAHHFPIYVAVTIDGETRWFANRDKYSRSTTRHQRYARPVWDGAKMHWLSTAGMQTLVNKGYRGLIQSRLLGGVAV